MAFLNLSSVFTNNSANFRTNKYKIIHLGNTAGIRTNNL